MSPARSPSASGPSLLRRMMPARSAPLMFAVMLLAGCAASGPRESARDTGLYAFWPQFPAEPRLQFVDSYQYSEDVEPERGGLQDLIYGENRRVLPINKPYGLEMHDGRIYVCDTKNAVVIVLDLRNQQTRVIGAGGAVRFNSPTDIAIAPDGTMYVTDSSRGVILVFNAEERYVTSIGFPGFRPTGIAVHENELYVCDFVSQSVQVLDRTSGERVRQIGERGDRDGQFVRPLGIDVDREGNVYVSDVIRCRIQKFNPAGELQLAFGEIGDSIGSFVRPKLVSVDRDGTIYVIDAAFANVQMFDQEGKLLMFFGIAGTHPGSMKLPAGVCVHEGDIDLFAKDIHPGFEPQRLVLVTNQFGANKVSVYAFGRVRPGFTARDLASAQAEMPTGLEEGVPIDPLTGLPAREELDPSEAPEVRDAADDGEQ